jgi:hydrogenase small subunit
MAITRRQFVTRLGALAAAAGLGQAEVAKITEVFAYGTTPWNTFSGKPRVVWVHGAECTGCSTSLLSLFEDATAPAVEGMATTTLAALGLATGPTAVPRTLDSVGLNVDRIGTGETGAAGSSAVVNIQDVLVDIIELDYHETVMSMGGDMAAKWLKDFMDNVPNDKPFVLVVEGAIAPKNQGGAWADDAGNGEPWCSIGMTDDFVKGGGGTEHAIDTVVATLAAKASCAAVIAIGQCATFGGYPGCKSPIAPVNAGGFDPSLAQSGAMGTYDFLYLPANRGTGAYNKVINVPGCPTNPWWFILTVVVWLVDRENEGVLGILDPANNYLPKASAIDSTRRLKLAYPYSIHGPYCPRYNDYSVGKFAQKPGDPGCLQKIGCKGPAVKSLCGAHGWNAQQPHNDGDWEFDLAEVNPMGAGFQGGHCTRAGHPCMGCTEKGYPDSFVPFVTW